MTTKTIIGHFHRYDLPLPPSTGMAAKLASALRGEDEPTPRVGDYVRVINMLDGDHGCIGHVYGVDDPDQPSYWYCTIYIRLNPFGGGVKTTRPIAPTSIVILTPLEVLAEAAR